MKLLTQQTVTCAASSTTSVSVAVNIEFAREIAAQVDISGSATVKLQHSNDNTNWVDISSASTSTDHDIIETSSNARYVRAHLTASAGTPSAIIAFNAKP